MFRHKFCNFSVCNRCFIGIDFSFIPVGLLISALAANVKIGIFTLIGMRLRRVVPSEEPDD